MRKPIAVYRCLLASVRKVRLCPKDNDEENPFLPVAAAAHQPWPSRSIQGPGLIRKPFLPAGEVCVARQRPRPSRQCHRSPPSLALQPAWANHAGYTPFASARPLPAGAQKPRTVPALGGWRLMVSQELAKKLSYHGCARQRKRTASFRCTKKKRIGGCARRPRMLRPPHPFKGSRDYLATCWWEVRDPELGKDR